MKKVFLQLCILVFLFGLNVSVIAQPTPLGESNFPKNGDSTAFRTNVMTPMVSFTDANYAADTISVDRGLYKALNSVGDDDMKNLALNKGADRTWDVVSFIYNGLPNPKIGNKVYKAWNKYIPGATSFPSANLYYPAYLAGTNNNVFLKNDATGFYELGTRVMQSPAYNLVNSVPKPIVKFPLDYNTPKNVENLKLNTDGGGAYTKTLLNVTVDAWGTLNLVLGTPSNPKVSVFSNCIRTMTESVDTSSLPSAGFEFYIHTKIYAWYAPGYPDPIVQYSYATIRNNIDPSVWSYDPSLPWHDEVDMMYTTYYKAVGIGEQTNNNTNVYIYPNPSKGNVNVILNKQTDKYKNIQVTDMLGNIVYKKDISNLNNDVINIDLTNQAKGLYLLNVNSDKNSITKKIVIQ